MQRLVRTTCGGLRGVVLAGACVFVCIAAGCSSSAEVTSRGTTVGQELKDLEDARARGLLTESEYQDKRDDILDRD